MNKRDLKPLPKPVRLDVPRTDKPPEKREPAVKRVPPKQPPVDKGLGFYEDAQRKHGRLRPVPPPPKKKEKPPGKISGGLGLISLGIICLGLTVLGVVMLLSNNSLAVYLDDTRIGYLQLNRETRDWDPGYIQTQAVNHRAAIIDANILVNEQVSLKHVRANRRYHETITVIIREVSQNFTYQILATAIYVDNERIAVMRTQSLANHVANHFIGAHRNTNTTEAYIEGWELKTLTVKDENLDSTDTAIQRLDRSVETIIPYVVQSGDTKGAIALRHGIPFDRLLADNDLKADAIIRPGDIINIRSTRPFLTVRTIQEETRTESIPKEVIRNYNDQLAMGDIKILQEGRDGERTVVVRKTFINGQFSTEEIISTVITTQPETRVVEEGTSEAAAPEWRP